MLIHFGADHGGFQLKESLKNFLRGKGYDIADEGNATLDAGDDFPVFAAKVGKAVSLAPSSSRGVLSCRSGVGVDVVANKFPGVRSVLALSPEQVLWARRDDDANVLCLAAEYMSEEDAKEILEIFLKTAFTPEERMVRRLKQIADIEKDIRAGL